jgi:septal ring factor EnvC (AmiA/AmiB activator)
VGLPHRKFNSAVAVAILVCTPGLLNGQVVEVRREILESQRRLEQVRQERSNLQLELNSLDGRVRDASAELANVERLVSVSRSALAEIDFQVNAVGGEIETTSRELLQTRERLLTGTAVLHRRLRDIYKRGTMHSVRVMLGAGSFSDLLTRYRYLRLIASYDRTLVRSRGELETDLIQQNNNLQASMASLGRLRQSRLGDVASLRSVEQQHLRAIDDYRDREATATNRLEQLDADETRVAILLTQLETRRVELERTATRPGAPATALTAAVGTMAWPVEGELVYQFGRDVQPNGTVLRWNGIGIRAETGTPVRAVEAGSVAFSGPFEGYGLTVWIDHGGGFYTLYLYLEQIEVSQGRAVAVGEVVGTVGGATTPEGPHLEFQILAPTDGGAPRAQDPLAWLRARGG